MTRCATLIAFGFAVSIAVGHGQQAAATRPAGSHVWQRARGIGDGCWPDCTRGQWCWSQACTRADQWPLAIQPLVGFANHLWMVANASAWRSRNGAQWEGIASNAAWGERAGMPVAFFRDRLWTFGGMEKSWDNFRNDVWSSSDGRRWERIAPHAEWSPRRGHAVLVYANRMWVLGGAESSGRPDRTPTRMLNDVWQSADGKTWRQATDRAPWAGSYNAVVFDGRMWVIGRGGAWHSTDGQSWTEAVRDASWLDRGPNAEAGCVAFDNRIWIFGGLMATGTRNDVWFSTDGARWQSAGQAPWSPRTGEFSAVFDSKLWIFGGKTGRASKAEEGFASDVWYLERAR